MYAAAVSAFTVDSGLAVAMIAVAASTSAWCLAMSAWWAATCAWSAATTWPLALVTSPTNEATFASRAVIVAWAVATISADVAVTVAMVFIPVLINHGRVRPRSVCEMESPVIEHCPRLALMRSSMGPNW